MYFPSHNFKFASRHTSEALCLAIIWQARHSWSPTNHHNNARPGRGGGREANFLKIPPTGHSLPSAQPGPAREITDRGLKTRTNNSHLPSHHQMQAQSQHYPKFPIQTFFIFLPSMDSLVWGGEWIMLVPYSRSSPVIKWSDLILIMLGYERHCNGMKNLQPSLHPLFMTGPGLRADPARNVWQFKLQHFC